MVVELVGMASIEEGADNFKEESAMKRHIDGERKYWESMDDKRKDSQNHLLVGMYAMVLVTTGCVMNMTTALIAKVPQEAIFHLAYHIILYFVSFGVMIHFFVTIIWPYELKPKREAERRRREAEKIRVVNGSVTMELPGNEKELDIIDVREMGYPLVAREKGGVHLYLRIGLILFGIAGMIQDGFKIAILFEFPYRCLASLFVPISLLRPMFLFVQACFLVKSHTIIINVNKFWVRFGIGHLIATNLCIWIWTVVEDSTAYTHRFLRSQQGGGGPPAGAGGGDGHGPPAGFGGEDDHGAPADDSHADDSHDVHRRAAVPSHDDHGPDLAGYLTTVAYDLYNATKAGMYGGSDDHGSPYDNHAPAGGNGAPAGAAGRPPGGAGGPPGGAGGPPGGIPAECILRSSLSWSAGPFLNPCFVEFSLIAVAILYRIYSNIGEKPISPEEEDELVPDPQASNHCHRANTGLFGGCGVVLWMVIAVGVYMKSEANYTPDEMNGSLYFMYITIDLITLFGFFAIIVSARAMATMHYADLQARDMGVNGNLSFITLLGVITYDLFKIVCCIKFLVTVEYRNFVAMTFISSIVSSVQAVSQTVYIMDGLYRCAGTTRHQREKPGRNAVTFLLACNMALWIAAMFETKKYDTPTFFKDFYSHVAWIIITFLFVPLVILFRFHATVCLSQIWGKAYNLKKKKN